ncbi:hypothetical protein [Microbulbifer sp. S227A]|uniref:hypothetical protein n=1 Tax=Microbulbifer sp. S227A TaxID=3415131 RepID=UPI003C7A5B52
MRDTSGDLPMAALHAVQNGLASAKAATYAALAEGGKNPALAAQFMATIDGPESLETYQDNAATIETAAAAWNTMLQTQLRALPAARLISLPVRSDNGIDSRHIATIGTLTAAEASGIRTSTELANLVAAFEAAGA